MHRRFARGPIRDCGAQRGAENFDSGILTLRIADYPPIYLGLCLIATYRQLCPLLFVQDIPVTQQAEAQGTSQKVGPGACDDRRNNVPDIRGRNYELKEMDRSSTFLSHPVAKKVLPTSGWWTIRSELTSFQPLTNSTPASA